MMIAVFKWVALLDPETMLTVVHAVCRRWWQLCGDTQDVRFDFTFLPDDAKLRNPPVDVAAEATMVGSLAALAGRFKHVMEVSMRDVIYCTSAESYAIALLERCPHLTAVNFSSDRYTCALTDASVTTLAKHCPQLNHVSFNGWGQLTDASVVALAEHCPHLSHVDFALDNELTDAIVVALAEHCPLLNHINFKQCESLTDVSVVALAEHCPQLTDVNFD
jgi:hypothetical protein